MSHGNNELLYAALIPGYDPDTSAEVNTTVATSPGFSSSNTSTPARKPFPGRLKQPVYVRRSLIAGAATYGGSSITVGEIIINNPDGAYDHILDYSFDGREPLIYLLTPGEDPRQFPANYNLIATGLSMEQSEYNFEEIKIRVRDCKFDMAVPIQTNVYAGDNVLPAGVEGTAEDIKGQVKPRCWGKVLNFKPVLVNTARLIYQVNDGEVADIPNTYDNGIELTKGVARASLAALESNVPAAGTYDYYLGSGGEGAFIRINGNPEGTVTCNVLEGATAADRTIAAIFQRILLEQGYTLPEINTARLTELDTFTSSAVVGIFIDEPVTIKDVFDELMQSWGAWWGKCPTGLFAGSVFEEPSASAVESFIHTQVVHFQRISNTGEKGAGLPVWRVVVRYARNYTVQVGDNVAATVLAARKAWIEREYREAVAEDDTVLVKHPHATTLILDTLLTEEADALAFAAYVLALRKVQRDAFDVRVAINKSNPTSINLDDTISIALNRFGMNAGKNFRVTSIQVDPLMGMLNLYVWG